MKCMYSTTVSEGEPMAASAPYFAFKEGQEWDGVGDICDILATLALP